MRTRRPGDDSGDGPRAGRQLERALRLIGRVPDETALRLVRLLVEIPDTDVLPLLEAMSRLSPAGARRATKLIAGVVRTVGR